MPASSCSVQTWANAAFSAFWDLLSRPLHGMSRAVTPDFPVELCVTSLSGEVAAKLSLISSTTVQEVQQCLAKCNGDVINAKRIQLIFKDQVLESSQMLSDVGFNGQQNFTMQVIHRANYNFTFTDSLGSKQYDYLHRIHCVGDPLTGKTSLLCQYADGVCPQQPPPLFPGASRRMLLVDGKYVVKLDLWEPTSRTYLQHINRQLYHVAHAFIVVFDVTNRESFEHVGDWLAEADKYGNSGAPVCLVGNKVDLQGLREVPETEAAAFACMHGLPYFETSAKEPLDLVAPVHNLVTTLLDQEVGCVPSDSSNGG